MIPLGESAQATFNAAGVATATLKPVPFGQTWRVTATALSTTSALRTSAGIYRTTISPATRLDGTVYNGNAGTTDTPITLLGGDVLTVQWTGGTPGAVATVTVTGERG